jgi:Outer membrane protein beta-barrel domain
MKKILSLSALLLVITLAASAQSASKPGIHLGIKADANLTKIDGQSYNNGFNLNYSLGAYLKIQFTRRFGLQPEVNFAQSTSTVSNKFSDIYNTILNPNYDKTVRLNYLEIPILANFGITNHLFIQVGPQYGILINDHENLVDNGKNAFTNGDFSMVGGLWLELPMHINIHARYLVGLNNINNLGNQDQWKSQAIQLGVGFTL